MFCTACGATLPDTARFCSRCGAVQGAVQASVPVAVATPRYEPPRPAAAFPPAPTPYAAPTYAQRVDSPVRYRSPGGLAVWVIVSLLIAMVTDAGAVISNLLQAALLEDVRIGVATSQETLEQNDARQALIGLSQMGSYLITTILFLCWISRCYRNVEAISRWKRDFGSGWAVGSWFVPFLNLVRPYKIVRETWWVSTYPDLADDVGAGFTPSGNALLGFWWAAYLLMNLLGQITFRMTMAAKTPSELSGASFLGAIADAESIVAAILCAAVVGVISSRQQAVARARGLAV